MDTSQSHSERHMLMFNTLNEQYLCPICNEILINTTLTNCGHRFCRYCLTLSMRSYPNCLKCSKRITSAKPDETTDAEIGSIFHNCCSSHVRKQRSENEKTRTLSEQEMKTNFKTASVTDSLDKEIIKVPTSDIGKKQKKQRHTGKERNIHTKDEFLSMENDSKILEEKLFKTYDQLLSQIGSSNRTFQETQSSLCGPQGDCSAEFSEQEAKIEQVARMAAKTASEAFQNLSQADELLQEADDVLGIIDFLKNHSMESIEKDAQDFSADVKATFDEKNDSEVNQKYENMRQILSTISSKNARPKANSNCFSSSLTQRKPVLVESSKGYYIDTNATQMVTHMKKCQEALQRIRQGNIKGSFVDAVSGFSKNVKNQNVQSNNSNSIFRNSVKRKDIEDKQNAGALPPIMNGRRVSNTSKLAYNRKPSSNESPAFKLPPLNSQKK